MPRKSRNYFANTPYLIFQFGHNFQPCFFENEDYDFFTQLMLDSCAQHQAKLLQQKLFNNQFFLLLNGANSHSLPKVLQNTCSIYGRYINDKYLRTGSLWQGRHKASPIQDGIYIDAVNEFISTPVLPRQFSEAKTLAASDLSVSCIDTLILANLARNQAIGDDKFLGSVKNHKMLQTKKTIVPRTRHGLMPLLSDRPPMIRT